MKKEEGITLVALIITIIILIILAAITLQTVVVDGILNLASQGSINYSQAQSNEVSMLDGMNDRLQEVTSTLGEVNADPDAGKDEPDSVYTVLKVGDFVKYYYSDTEEPLLCKVLYDKAFDEVHNTNYGVQIITLNNLGEVILGTGDSRIETDAPEEVQNGNGFTKATWSYNNAVETLNKVGEKYLSSYVTGVRSVGSTPTGKEYENGYYVDETDEEFNEKYANTFKNVSGNPSSAEVDDGNFDWNQLSSAKIEDAPFGFPVWLASRTHDAVTFDGYGTLMGTYRAKSDVRA